MCTLVIRCKSLLVLVAGLIVATPTFAVPIAFTAVLNGPNESPANISPGTGTAEVIIDADAHLMRVVVAFQDLQGVVTASHIHVINGPGDSNILDTLGPVATTVPSFPGFPTGVMSGAYDQTFDTSLASTYRAGWIIDAGGLTSLAEQALFAGISSGRAYLNIHTDQFPGGEIRGFLQPQSFAVPEPAPIALMLCGLLVLARIGSRLALRPNPARDRI
jgi:CHRD domain